MKRSSGKAVKAPASLALGTKPKGVPLAAKGGGVSTGGSKLPAAAAELPRRKKVPCPVFGCTHRSMLWTTAQRFGI
jgi:hypothetical protein